MQKVVLITGASSGIGFVTANYLSDKGYKVYGLSRKVPTQKAYFEFIEGDVTSIESIKNAINQIIKNEGRLDIVINNAGMGISGASEHNTKQEIERIFEVNVFGTIELCKASIAHLRKTKGQIINIGSVAAELNIPFQSYYSATKASVQAFSTALRGELRPFGIRVSTVLPGDTKTSFTANRQKSKIESDKIYGERIKNSLKVMERDEQGGMPAISVSKVIYKLIKAKNPSVTKVVGCKYKTFVFLKRILPSRLINYVIYKMYGGN